MGIKMSTVIIFTFLSLVFTASCAFAGGATIPATPITVEITDGATGLSWNQNTESDLAGYFVAYSVNDEDYSMTNTIDTGLVNSFQLSSLPTYLWVADNRVDFVVHAYDLAGNISFPSNEVGISFFENAPPAAVSGLSKTY